MNAKEAGCVRMLLFENISLAISGLLANKMRALLTMLGIIIGIGSVIAIMTVGNSMSNSLTESMQSMGANNITVSLTQKSDESYTEGGMTRMFRMQAYRTEDLMTPDMLEEYQSLYGDQIHAIGLTERVGDADVEAGTETAPGSLEGVNADYNKVTTLTMQKGRWLSQVDEDEARMAVVVSDVLCEALFGVEDPIGKSFSFTHGNKVYTLYIVGVYEYESNGYVMQQQGETPSTTIYMPLSTAKQIAHSDAGCSNFTVVAASGVDTALFLQQTESFFASLYTRNDSYTVTASSMESLMESMQEMMGSVSLAISIIAGISLLVGGIGVMNIMLVSITERTREIGTRKALGATNGSIRIQFIVESVMICLIGGALGILVGVGLGGAGASLLGYAASPSVSVIAIAVGFSMAIGVFFGYYPANKAAKLDPIEALRYE